MRNTANPQTVSPASLRGKKRVSCPVRDSVRGLTVKLLKVAYVGYGNVVPVYETPAFPAVEEQQQHRDEREPNAPGKYSRCCPRAVSDVPVDRRDHYGNQVASHMQPRVRNVANARF